MKHKTIIMIIGALCSLLLAEQVCKIRYKGSSEELHNSTLTVSDQAVALSEHITVSSPKDSITSGTNSSVYFVIDHSGSMYSGFKENKPNDQWGSRFTVTSDLIDTIFNKNPNTEVGLVFFRRVPYMTSFDERELMVDIDPINPYNGSYLKLLQLNKEYTSQALGAATGYEILKHYLKTRKKSFGSSEYTDLEYKPSIANIGESQFNSGTNISIGFEAAKMGFKDAQYDKDNHYIIFFSDGEATEPSADSTKMMEYIDGKDVPTTFTVFFTPDNSALANLNTMTDNIRNNGYSGSNPQSQLHTIETDHAKLMKLLMDNAIGTILSQVNTNIPISLDINASDSDMDWDGQGFSFNKLFPLTDTETEFNYTIKYKIKKDTISRTTREAFDTVENDVRFTVKTEPGYSMPDTLEAQYWDRSISFYYNGTEISKIEPHMDEIEVRFTSTKIDTFYTYENVNITLTTTEGSVQDEETLNLEEKNGYHWATFKREIGDAAKNDGTLQHRNPDVIRALFRNPDLPLDTLAVTIDGNGQDEFTITGGTYFDTDADGRVDSLFLDVSPDTRLEPVVDAIVNAIELPGYRTFIVNSSSYKSGGISFQVEENRSERETAIVENEDVMTIAETKLNETARLLAGDFTFRDAMAPVVIGASLIDSVKAGAKDLLTVRFSESVSKVDASTPLRFYSVDKDGEHDPKLAVENENGSEIVFRIESIDGGFSVIDGDSLKIHSDASPVISDSYGNGQENWNNRREVISVTVIEEGIRMTGGAYFDRNADGKIDSISVDFDGVNLEQNIDALFDAVALPAFRKFNVDSHRYQDGGLAIEVWQDISDDEINTAVTSEDELVIADQIVTDSDMKILQGTVAIEDRVAPVILEAHFVDSIFQVYTGGVMSVADSGTDLLTVTFSEELEAITESKPFLLWDRTEDRDYRTKLELLEQSGDREYRFAVHEIIDAEKIEERDSIRIREGIADPEGNVQENRSNVRREISAEEIVDVSWKADEVNLVLKTTIFDPNEEIEFDRVYAGIDRAGIYEGAMVLIVEPENRDDADLNERDVLTGKLSLVDYLGNTIFRGEEMEYDEENRRLIYVWDGKNRSGRTVGSGAYSLVVEFERSFFTKGFGDDPELVGGTQVITTSVGVRQ